jgi:hypothetical protein
MGGEELERAREEYGRLQRHVTRAYRAVLTFDEALDTYANADDDHLRRYVAEERAILEAFAEWIAEPRNHELAEDLEGADLENDEILDLIRRALAQRD